MHKLNYDILASGSSGNCIIIENLMFDVGVSYRLIKPYLYDIDYIFISHIHSDHIKINTANRIKKDFPNIKFIGNYEVNQIFELDIIAINTKSLKLKNNLKVTPFKLVHDVVNTGFTWQYKGHNIIFATDTVSLDYAPKLKYNYFFIESNHDINKVKEVQKNYKKGYKTYLDSLRHLSIQEAKAFYYINRLDKNSKFIELHKSNRFY